LKNAALGSAGLILAPRLRAQNVHLSRKPNLVVFLPDQFRADTAGVLWSALHLRAESRQAGVAVVHFRARLRDAADLHAVAFFTAERDVAAPERLPR
jgi:hypothetical protein